MEPFLVILVIALVVGAIVIGAHFERKRREALAAWALANGWSWRPGKGRAPDLPVDLFRTGHSRYSRHHMGARLDEPTPGLDGADCEMFGYHYAITTGSGKDRSTSHYHFTCAIVRQRADLGGVLIRREGLADKLFQSVGFDDIDLEDPDFSSAYVVKARSRKDAYDLLGPSLMRYLVASPGWRVQTLGRTMLVHDSGRMNPERCAALASFVGGFLTQLPRTLVNAARAADGRPPIIEAGAAAGESLGRLAGARGDRPGGSAGQERSG